MHNIACGLPDNLVFILGLQRSGTTWLSNLFDVSRDVLMFMEPFAPEYGIFPEFPDQGFYLENSSAYLTNILRVELPRRLMLHKSFIFPNSWTNPKLFRLENFLGERLSGLMPARLHSHYRKFRQINLNRTEKMYPLHPKDPQPSTWVIKELRLSGKIPLLLDAFPSAHYVVIIRHPCGTVHSILNWFSKGVLVELSREVMTFLDRVETQSKLEPYTELIKLCRKGEIAQLVSLYWRINYETICQELKNYENVTIITYEQLALQPDEVTRKIFNRVGLDWSSQLQEYISFSTKTKPRQTGPVTTIRDSAEHVRSWEKKISKETRNAIEQITESSFLMSYFAPFYK